MMNLLLSPSGRITPSQYMTGMVVIGVASALVALLGIYVPALEIVATLVSLVLFYAFFALGIKRSHDAGKSGWLSITHLLLLLGVASLVLGVLWAAFGADFGALMEATMSGDPALAEAAGERFEEESALPSALSNFIIYPATAFIVNMLNRHDPTPNQYGNVIDANTFE